MANTESLSDKCCRKQASAKRLRFVEPMKKFELDTSISATPKPDKARIRNTRRVINADWFNRRSESQTHGLCSAPQQPLANLTF